MGLLGADRSALSGGRGIGSVCCAPAPRRPVQISSKRAVRFLAPRASSAAATFGDLTGWPDATVSAAPGGGSRRCGTAGRSAGPWRAASRARRRPRRRKSPRPANCGSAIACSRPTSGVAQQSAAARQRRPFGDRLRREGRSYRSAAGLRIGEVVAAARARSPARRRAASRNAPPAPPRRSARRRRRYRCRSAASRRRGTPRRLPGSAPVAAPVACAMSAKVKSASLMAMSSRAPSPVRSRRISASRMFSTAGKLPPPISAICAGGSTGVSALPQDRARRPERAR